MSVYDILLIPALFGLVGFFEPCSLGINIIFLNTMKGYSRPKRVLESMVFTLSRGLILALVGVSAAFIGNRFVKVQSSLFLVLGLVFIGFGILSIINMYRPIFNARLNLGGVLKNTSGLSLGLAFGLVIPACAIALVLALIGKTVLMGDLLEGFSSLFVFGVTLSLPLVFISYSEQSIRIIQKIHEKTRNLPWLAGAVMIVVGILTILSTAWWFNAIP